MKFMCFGGGAGDGHEEAVASPAVEEAPRRDHQRRVSLTLASSLFRGKFLSHRGKGGGGKDNKKMKKFMSDSEERTRDADCTDSVYGAAPSMASSSSAPLSLSSASSSSSISSRSSSSSSSLRALIPYSRRTPPTTTKRASPAAGAAAVVALCLLMLIVLCCGRLGATLLTSTALYLLPRPARKKAVSSASERGRGTETGGEEGG